jgi:hypothetical protein
MVHDEFYARCLDRVADSLPSLCMEYSDCPHEVRHCEECGAEFYMGTVCASCESPEWIAVGCRAERDPLRCPAVQAACERECEGVSPSVE